MNKENLLKLAAYLLSSDLAARFDMRLYSNSIRASSEQIHCETIGCAVGHGPYAGIPKRIGETWSKYADRVFQISTQSSAWAWCFSSMWHPIDNTPEGAGKRILHMIRHGLPRNWEMQITGHAELTYVDETF